MDTTTIFQLLSSLRSGEENVTDTERILSAAGGGFLLYSALTGKRMNLLKASAGALLMYRAISGHCPVYSSMGKHSVHPYAQNVNIRQTIYVSRPVEEVYDYWRKLDQLPLFMKHLESVKEIDALHSKWTATIPGLPGGISWMAEIVKDDPGSVLAWKSLPEATIENAGKVEFADAGNGVTVIDALITYHAPLGQAGEALARVLNPVFANMIKQDLRNFEQIMENNDEVNG